MTSVGTKPRRSSKAAASSNGNELPYEKSQKPLRSLAVGLQWSFPGGAQISQELSTQNEEFLSGQLASGIDWSRDEAIDAGVGLLRQREQLVARLEESGRQLDSGFEASFG